MASCKGPKRLFDLESSASSQQAASNTETERVQAKRLRTAMGNSGDDFEGFLALLGRIQFMKTKHTGLGIREAISSPAQDMDVKVIRTKSPWIPSFEWEDFCGSAKKNICGSSAEEIPSSSEEKGKQSTQPANPLITPSFSRDRYDNLRAESLDLNVEPSS